MAAIRPMNAPIPQPTEIPRTLAGLKRERDEREQQVEAGDRQQGLLGTDGEPEWQLVETQARGTSG